MQQESQNENPYEIPSSFLVYSNMRDRILHYPFHFLSCNIFASVGIVLAFIFSFVIDELPMSLLIIIGGGVGYGVQFLLKPNITYPPYFVSEVHAAQYDREEDWATAVEMAVNFENEQMEKMQAEQEAYEQAGAADGESNIIDKAQNVYEGANNIIDTATSLIEDPLGTISDGIIGKIEENIKK